MANIIPFDKFARLFSIIKQHGGIRGFLYQLYRRDEAKDGVLVGTDKDGNKYYENPLYFYGRNRWVHYADKYGMDYDGSQVPAEWYGWLHYKTDLKPSEDPARPKYSWMSSHQENLTGTENQYVPYTTTKPKIQAWVPPSCK